MRENINSVVSLIGAVFFLTTIPIHAHALTPGQVFDKVKDSVVVVKTLDAQGKVKMQGSGVLLPSGKIATNCHVVEGGASYQVGRGKQFVRATLYAEDGDKDLCLLDAKGITGKPAQLGKAADLKIGDPVYSVGAPQGLELSLSDGIVSQLRGGSPPFIQTTAAISPGSSGGALFDGEGRLVGLTTLYIEGGQSLNFAMPVEWIGELKPGRKPASYKSAFVSSAKETGRDGRFIAYNNGTVSDTRTGLVWAAKDNGSNINWANAKSYCENYRGGGYTDWRMPTQDELAGLYDSAVMGKTYKLTNLIELTSSCPWASETELLGPDAASLDFYDGYRYWLNRSHDKVFRALPVRSGK